MTRLGLCCLFREAPIKFRVTTVRHLQKLRTSPKKEKEFLSELIVQNSENLFSAIAFCSENGIGAFRIMSQFFPAFTHPEVGYRLDDLPQSQEIKQLLNRTKKLAKERNIRLTYHPDPFVVLSGPSHNSFIPPTV